MKKWIEQVKVNGFWRIAFLFITAKLCLHFFTITHYELHRDEMLYFHMGDHLDWGYASVPPLIGLMAFLSKSIFGYSVFGIRFFPVLLGAYSMVIMAGFIRKLGGGIFALIIALSSFLFSGGFLLFNGLFTPNVIEQFLWLLLTWNVFKMTSESNPKQWIWIGILIGLAFLNKYSVVFLIAGFAIALFFSPYRKLFFSRYFIYALLIVLIIVSPNIYWQYAHNWPVVFHMKELKNTQLVNMKYVHFFYDAFSLYLLATVVWMVGLFALLLVKKEKRIQYLGWGSLITMLLFLFSGGKGYYTMGLIPFLMAYGGYAMEKYLTGKLRIIGYTVIFSSVVVALVALPYALPVFSLERLDRYSAKTGHLIIYPFYRWEDGKVHPVSQVYSDMTGWQELTTYAAKAYDTLSKEERKNCTIFCEKNYGYAGAIHFYGKKYGLPEPITFLDSYVIWAPDSIPLGPIIYINYNPADLINLYNSVVEVGSVNNSYFRENGLKVFLCTDPQTRVSEVYAQLASKAKLVYRKY